MIKKWREQKEDSDTDKANYRKVYGKAKEKEDGL